VLVLGEGSNLLFATDHPGVVVCLAMAGTRVLEDDGAHALVRADAGVNWNDFVRWTIGKGLSGLENMALIPGTVGACPIQNIGAYGRRGPRVHRDRRGLPPRHAAAQAHQQCRLRLRLPRQHVQGEPRGLAITAVEFRLPRERALRLDYAGVKEELAAMGVDSPRPAHVAEAISRIRTRKLPNPR
jgi:UDP-N-acetylmuramate dehydrogenase